MFWCPRWLIRRAAPGLGRSASPSRSKRTTDQSDTRHECHPKRTASYCEQNDANSTAQNQPDSNDRHSPAFLCVGWVFFHDSDSKGGGNQSPTIFAWTRMSCQPSQRPPSGSGRHRWSWAAKPDARKSPAETSSDFRTNDQNSVVRFWLSGLRGECFKVTNEGTSDVININNHNCAENLGDLYRIMEERVFIRSDRSL